LVCSANPRHSLNAKKKLKRREKMTLISTNITIYSRLYLEGVFFNKSKYNRDYKYNRNRGFGGPPRGGVRGQRPLKARGLGAASTPEKFGNM